MHTLRLRLITLFVAIVTLTLGLFGAYSQYQLSKNLEMQLSQLKQGVLARLQINLPEALWLLDEGMANSIIESEMLSGQVIGVRVTDNYGKLFSGKFLDSNKKVVPITAGSRPAGLAVNLPLRYRSGENAGTELGRAQIYFSRENIDLTLRAELVRRAAEILLLDGVLLLALSFSLRTVFIPLAQLRDALFELAGQDSDEARQLPENTRNEFGEVIRGFNQIQNKLRRVIEKQRQNQKEAQEATQQARQSYEELQRTQEVLLQSEKLASLGGLVAGVAHEINTPVGVTLTSASVLNDATDRLRQSLEQGAVRKSEMLAYLDTAAESARLILSNAERAAHLIASFKQIAADQSSEVRRNFELKAYLDEIIASLGPKLKRSAVRVGIECAEPVPMDGYPGALAQVITNLTINSITHAYPEGKGGQVSIGVEKREANVRIRFKDDGCGIPPADLGRIFEPFFTTRRGQGGTGLGLNIVYNIVTKQFGGTIAVESAPGQGTCFTLDLPCIAPRA